LSQVRPVKIFLKVPASCLAQLLASLRRLDQSDYGGRHGGVIFGGRKQARVTIPQIFYVLTNGIGHHR
jgi:hypothetical protein